MQGVERLPLGIAGRYMYVRSEYSAHTGIVIRQECFHDGYHKIVGKVPRPYGRYHSSEGHEKVLRNRFALYIC